MNEKDFEISVLLEIYNSDIGVAAFDSNVLGLGSNLTYDESIARRGAVNNLRLDGLIEHVTKQTYKLTPAGWKAAAILNYSLNKTKDVK
jgi:hypothetical protein